jgi:hypothetical protein
MRGKCRTGRRTTRGRLLTRRTGGCRLRSETEKERSAATMAWRITPKEYSPIRFSILSPEFCGRGSGDAESSIQNRPVARNSVIADLRPPTRNPSVKGLGLLRRTWRISQENSWPTGATVAVPTAAQTERRPMTRGMPPRKRREYGRKHAAGTGLGVKDFGAGKLVEKHVAPQETHFQPVSPGPAGRNGPAALTWTDFEPENRTSGTATNSARSHA